MSDIAVELKNMPGIAFGKTWELAKCNPILATLTTSAAVAFSYILYKKLSTNRRTVDEGPFEIDQLLQDVSLMVRTAVRLKNRIVELQFLASHAPTQSQRELAQIKLLKLIQSQIPVYKHLSSLDQPTENGILEDESVEVFPRTSEEQITENHLPQNLAEQSTEARHSVTSAIHQQRIRYSSITSITSPGSDSFLSARDDEFFDRLNELEEQKIKNEFYFEGKRLSHLVEIRKNRVDLVKAIDLEDFKSKVYCLRKSMKILVTMNAERDYMENSLKTIITKLLNIANGDSSKFISCVDEMLNYIRADPHSELIMREELANRRVPVVEFGPFDVILDWVLMDLLEDMAKPPKTISSLLSVTWFSVARRAAGVTALVSATISAKRSRLTYTDGFMSRFYDISSSATPNLAASALIQDMVSHKPVMFFQKELSGFLSDIFDLEISDYTSPVTLTNSIISSMRDRTERINALLSDACAAAAVS